MLGNILAKQQKRLITLAVGPTQNPHIHHDTIPLSRTSTPQLPKNPQIPSNSTISQPSHETLIKTQSSLPPKTQEQMYKIMCMMREQIQISSSFYTNKMKQLLQDQAKQIVGLRETLVQNQRELIKKNTLINQLRAQKQRQTPKKKMSVISSQPQILLNQPESYNQLTDKIQTLQVKLANLENNITEKHQAQLLLNNRIEKIQKGTVKLMASKVASCSNKLDKYLIKKQKQIQKIYADCINLSRIPTNTSQISQPLHSANSTHNSPHSTKLTKLSKQLTQLKQQISILKTKQYKYDNYQVEKLREELIALKKYVKFEEDQRKVQRNRGGQVRQFQSEKYIVTGKQPNNHMIKSQKYIQQIQPIRSTTNKNTVTYSKINLSNHTKSQPQPQQEYYARPIQNQLRNQQQNNQNLLLNHSTPSLLRNYSEGGNFVQNNSSKVLDRSGRLCSNINNNSKYQLTGNNSGQLTKTINLSTQASRSANLKNTPSTNSPLQCEFYERGEPNSPQSLEYQQQNSECEQYTESQQQYEQPLELQQRLINTIKQNNLRMPVLVEIDQTGCLKCLETGMYLVDLNNDVFYLEEWHMEMFVDRGILKEGGSMIR